MNSLVDSRPHSTVG